jgi:transposase
MIGSVPMTGHIPGDGIIVVDTRRRWSEEERQRALEDTKSASVSSVARKHGVAKSLLFRWRKEAGLAAKRRSTVPFVPVRIAAAPAINLPSSEPPASPEPGSIEIELVDGTKLRVNGALKSEVLKHVIAALRG